MARSRTHRTRPLHADDPAAARMAIDAGAHGVYVRNALAVDEGDGLFCQVDGVDRVLCWFGPRGNLIVIAAAALEPDAVAAVVGAIQVARRSWRIVMGPADVVDALRDQVVGKVLVNREQVYYGGCAAEAPPGPDRVVVRSAQRADRDRLVQATLMLNQSDLNIDPAHVDRRWLRDTIDERIGEDSTRLVGPIGAPQCKLDHGSDGPGGRVIEGVFTFPEWRGQGLATALVAACLRAAPGSVCLHVGKHNQPARSAYESAGMRVVGSCRLLLLG